MIGTFEHHHQWASWATSGAVLSAIYLLWAYQRVALGEVTVEKNRTLPDANGRERLILVAMSVMIIFMGIASPLFTRRMEASTDDLLRLMDRPQNASRPPAAAAGKRASWSCRRTEQARAGELPLRRPCFLGGGASSARRPHYEWGFSA